MLQESTGIIYIVTTEKDLLRMYHTAIPEKIKISKDKGGHSTGALTPPLAYVRYLNAVGDTLALDFHPIDQIEFSQPFLAVPFRAMGLGGYQGYQAGSRKIRVFPNSTDLATTSAFLVDTTLNLTAGTYLSLIHI